MRGTDGQRDLVPLVVRQAVREHLSVGLLAFGAVVKTHLTALATALQLQEPAETKRQQPASSNSHTITVSLRQSLVLYRMSCCIKVSLLKLNVVIPVHKENPGCISV